MKKGLIGLFLGLALFAIAAQYGNIDCLGILKVNTIQKLDTGVGVYVESVYHSAGVIGAPDDRPSVYVNNLNVSGTVTGISASAIIQTCNGRLTLESGVPVSTTDQTAKTTLYFTPYNGNEVSLYYNSAWLMTSFSETSLSISTLTASANYDIFGYYTGSALALEALAWTDATTRATALTTQDGIYVKNGDATRRYLGTIRITATTGQCEDSGFGNTTGSRRFVWNMYNRVMTRNLTYDTTDSWTDSGNGTFSICNSANAAWKHEFVVGWSQQVKGTLNMLSYGTSSYPIIAIGYNSATPDRSKTSIALNAYGSGVPVMCVGCAHISAGYSYIAGLNTSSASSAATFLGDNGGDSVAAKVQSNFITESER